MLLVHILIIKALLCTSSLAAVTKGNVSEEIKFEKNVTNTRDKRGLILGLLVRNLLAAAGPPPVRAQPASPPAMPPAGAPPPAMAGMTGMPGMPAPPPAALPTYYAVQPYSGTPFFTGPNGYVNFNNNRNFLVASPVVAPGPIPSAGIPAPPLPPAPPAPAPRITPQQMQQQAIISLLAASSGFPQTPAPPPGPLPAQPAMPAGMAPSMPADIQPGMPGQPAPILIPRGLLHDRLLFNNLQYEDISSEDHANHANIIDDHNEDIYHGHTIDNPEEEPSYSYLNAGGSSHDGHHYVEEPTYSYTDTEGFSPNENHYSEEPTYTYLNPEDAPHDTRTADLPSYPYTDDLNSPYHFNSAHSSANADRPIPNDYNTHTHPHSYSTAGELSTYTHSNAKGDSSTNGGYFYESMSGSEYSRFSKESQRRSNTKPKLQPRPSASPKKPRQIDSNKKTSQKITQTAKPHKSNNTRQQLRKRSQT